jgi:hypothetical protein
MERMTLCALYVASRFDSKGEPRDSSNIDAAVVTLVARIVRCSGRCACLHLWNESFVVTSDDGTSPNLCVYRRSSRLRHAVVFGRESHQMSC